MNETEESIDQEPLQLSKCVYIRGINRITTIEQLRNYFGKTGAIDDVSFSEKPRKGFGWVTYVQQNAADTAVKQLHHSDLNGSIITVRYEAGKTTESGVRSQKEAVSVCIPRTIKHDADGRPSKKQKTNKANVSYTGRGVMVDGAEYPIPQGTYLIKIMKLLSSSVVGNRQPLLDALLDARHGNKHAKELSESMAMVSAIQMLGRCTDTVWENEENVDVYVLADGLMPTTSIAICLFFPHWRFTSIDPIINYDTSALGVFASNISCVRALSQDFMIPSSGGSAAHTDSALDPVCCGSSPVAVTTPTVSSISSQYTDNATSDRCSSEETADGEGILYDADVIGDKGGIGGAVPVSRRMSIVIACHSHAPLQEFWNRVQGPKYCVSMPCCGKTWSHLTDTPVREYEDYEVFSPKRKIFLYYEKSVNC